MTLARVEIRCPVGPRRLLAILRQRGEKPVYTDENLIEFACTDCRRQMRRESEREVGRMLHRYNFIGELVETVEDSLR